MSMVNPEYKPDWKEIHDRSHAARTRLSREMDDLRASDQKLYDSGDEDYDSPQRTAIRGQLRDLREEWKVNHETCLRCLDTYQHKTIQDAAKWAFETFEPGGAFAPGTIHQMDFEKFTSLKEVRDAWSKANAISEQLGAEKTQALPVGRPGGKDIFEKTGTNAVTSAWQTFSFAERYPGARGDLWDKHTHTLVTVDERKGAYHVCFMQDPDIGRGGSYVSYEIEALATAIYKRALAAQDSAPKLKSLPDATAPGIRGALSKFLSLASGSETSDRRLRPDQFHFYIHHGPTPLIRESFEEVDLRFRGGKFELGDGRFTRMDVIPALIQQAHRNRDTLSRDAEKVAPEALAAPTRRLTHEG